MTEEKKFAKFIYFNQPHPKAPVWVLGQVVIKKEEFVTWLMSQDTIKGYVKLDVKQAKDPAKAYLEINDYVKPTTENNSDVADNATTQQDDDLPF